MALTVVGAASFGAVVMADGVAVLYAQEVVDAGDRAPRFLLAATVSSRAPTRIDVRRTPTLMRRISVTLRDVRLEAALNAIARQSGLELAYSTTAAPLDRIVRLDARDITVAAALTEVLLDAQVDVVFAPSGRAMLVKRGEGWRGQAGTIAGRVTDAMTGHALNGTDVRVAGTPLAAVTDDSGHYVLREVPAGAQRIMARRIGYQAQSRTVTVASTETVTVDFALSAAVTRLDEMVTTVTGEQRRLELGNAMVSLRVDSLLQTAPVMTFGDLLQGRAPGVLSMISSSKVGQSGTIRIRGLNSFGVSNDPIVVLDGVRIESSAGTGGNVTSQNSGGYTGRLSDLDPSEIESVEIVKGPAAATLYGTDAANGVLVITTKRGQTGRPRWTAFTEHALLQQRLEDWGRHYGGDPYYAFGTNTTTGAAQRCTLLQRAAGNCVLDSLVSFNTFEHPDTRPFKDGRREQYGLQVSGGAAGGMTYFLSGDYQAETGTWTMPKADEAFLKVRRGVTELPDWQLRPNAFRRVNLRANLTAPLGTRGSATLTTGFVSNRARHPGGFLVNVQQVGYRDANDGWIDDGFITSRPAYMLAERNEDIVHRFIAGLATSYQAREWLTLRGTAGVDLSANASNALIRRGEATPGSFFATGSRTAGSLDVARYSLDLGATATWALSPTVSSKTSIGVQYNRRGQRGATIFASNLPLGGQTIAGAANPLSAREATFTTAVAGGYVEELIGLRDRLFLTGALRFDGASAFGDNFAVAVYPKASVSWLLTDGRSGPRLPGVSSLRLRAAYGAAGVQPGPTAALQQIQVIPGASGTTATPAAQLGAFGNAHLKPERTREIEGGVDLELGAGRVRVEFTAYQRTSQDALVNRQLALGVGGGTRWENIGKVRNRGLELLVNAEVLRGRTLSAGVTLTGSVNDNKLLELGDGVVVSSPTTEGLRQDVGYPLQGTWARTVASYADANGNGIIEVGEITLTENRYIGPGFPPREATAAPYVSLFGERLRLSGLFQYRGGFYADNIGSGLTCLFDQSCRAVNDISTPLVDQAKAVALTQLFAYSGFVEPASYLVLRELSAGLTLPASWGRALGARDARLVVAARNVAVLSQRGLAVAPENDVQARDDGQVHELGGPSTYWLVRLNLSY